MYLAKTINEVLESKKDKLIGRPTYYYICHVLNKAFSNIEPFKFKHETYEEYGIEDYSVSGIYDMEEDVKYIILNFPKSCKTFTLKPERWKEFKFAVSQVCQHEAIHQCQWSYVSDPQLRERDKEKLDFRNTEGSIDEEQEYLADTDEIDAYGHDIAMEIAFYYPKKNPYKVLQDINKHRKIWSYKYYKRTYKNEDWSLIRNRLLKKAYKWIPHVHI